MWDGRGGERRGLKKGGGGGGEGEGGTDRIGLKEGKRGGEG